MISTKKYLQNIDNQQNIFLLLIAYGILYTFHYFFYFGHFGFDDMEYARLAHDFLEGRIDWANHYSYRIIPICLTAISYKLLGINDFASAMGAWVMTLLTLYALFRITKEEGWITKILLTLIFITYSWSLFYADKLMPDVYIMAFVTWSFERFDAFRQQRISAKKAAFSMAFLVWLGLLSKEIILLIFPAFILLFLVNIFDSKNNSKNEFKKQIQFWSLFLGSFLCFGFVYVLLLWGLSGDPLSRLTAMQAGEYANSCRYDLQPFEVLLERITHDFWTMCAKEGMLSPLIISLYGIILSFTSKNKYHYKDAAIFTLGLFLSANFMSISPKNYVPMCLDPRHFLYMLPFGALLLARQIKSIFDREPSFKMFNFSILGLSASIAFALGDKDWKDPLFGLVIGLGIFMMLEKLIPRYKLLDWSIFCMIFLGIVFYYRIENLKYIQRINYKEQKYKVLYFLEKTPANAIIYTDAALLRLMPYWLQFDSTKQFIFKNFLDNELIDNRLSEKNILQSNANTPPQYPPIFWLVSGHSLFLANQSIENAPPILKLRVGDTAYHCDDRAIWAAILKPSLPTKLIFNDSFLLDNQHFDLDLSSKIDFSIDTIAINISLNIRSTATTQAQFVINLLDSESLPYHEPLQKHLRTFGKDYYTLKKNILYLPEKNKFSKNKLRFSIENIEKTGKIESQKLQIAIFKISKF